MTSNSYMKGCLFYMMHTENKGVSRLIFKETSNKM